MMFTMFDKAIYIITIVDVAVPESDRLHVV